MEDKTINNIAMDDIIKYTDNSSAFTTVDVNVELPVFPKRSFCITEYGALCGVVNAKTNMKAINRAIEETSEIGGGHVIIPKGIWHSGPIELKSNVDLHLEKGAVLLFVKNKEDYPVIKRDYEGQIRLRAKSPISADDCTNIAITGDGIIDGNGQLWRVVKHFKVTERVWESMLKQSPYVIPTQEGGMWFPTKSAYDGCIKGEIPVDADNAIEEMSEFYDFLRPVMVDICRCDKVLIEGVTLQNSPNWNLHPIFCTNLTVRNAAIKNPYHAQNGDGIDIESCRYVEVADTSFDVGDDAICIKSGKNREGRMVSSMPTQDVHIHDCVVYHGHGGIVVGSEMSRGVKNVLVDNCTFMGTDTGIRFKSQLGRGGVVENIQIKDINMTDIIEEACIFTFGYTLYKMEHEKKEEDVCVDKEDIPVFKDVLIENVVCTNAKIGLKIQGLDISPIHDITFKNVVIHCDKSYEINYANDIYMYDTTLIEN